MEKNKIHIYLYNALIVLCLLGGAVYVVSRSVIYERQMCLVARCRALA